MPQDGSKSGSFFSCAGPKGVAECNTIRKSKTEYQKTEDKMENQKKQKNVSFSKNPSRKETFSVLLIDELDDPSYVELKEITRGAQKLNKVIDTWSSRISFDRQSKDIAKDLLKGALDLQESLEMLGKLQEASQHMAKWKRKQKEKAGGGSLDGANLERSFRNQFGSDGHRIEFQRPRHSVDGSTNDCYEELREAIREGLARQNLLPKISSEDKAYAYRTRSSAEEKSYFHKTKVPNEGKAYFERSNSINETNSYFDWTKLELSIDCPSTSSSQSSVCHSCEFYTSDTSFSKSFEEKSKGPNVISKLMGLEENNPKAPPPTLERQLRKEKGLNYGRPFLDVDFPKARRSHFSSIRKVDSRQRTLEELIQTVADKSGSQKHLSKVYDKRKWLADDVPPIVIIKPWHFPGSLEEDSYKQEYFCNDLDSIETAKKSKMKGVAPQVASNAKKGALNITEMQRSLQAEMSPSTMLSQDKGSGVYGNAYRRIGDRANKVLEELPSTKTKASVCGKPKVQKKEVIHEKVNKMHILAPNTRISTEVDNAKLKEASKCRNANKCTSTCPRKSDRVSKYSKDQKVTASKLTEASTTKAPLQKATTSNLADASTAKAPHITWKKKTEPENRLSIPPFTVLVESQLENDAIQINQSLQIEHDLPVTKLVISEKLACETENDASKSLDYCSASGGHLSDFTSPLIEQKSETKSSKDPMCCITNNPTEKRGCNREASQVTRNLILESEMFLDKLDKLFSTSAHRHTEPHTNSSLAHKQPDPKHLVDCAKELVEYKNRQCTHVGDPWSHILNKKSRISIEQLVTEIREGIEDLRSYHDLIGRKAAGDSLHKVLDRYIWCKMVVSGGWDLGWKSGFTPEELEQIAVAVELEILSEITTDALEDMLS